MEYYNNILCVEAEWLVTMGVLTSTNYRQLSARKDIRVVRRGCRNTPALVDYESMPSRFKQQIDAMIKNSTGGTVHDIARINEIAVLIEDSAEAANYYDEYTLDDGRHLSKEKRLEYYANAIVIDAIQKYMIRVQHKRQVMGMKAKKLWSQVAEIVQEIDRTRYPHQLPANPRSLERKCQAYQQEGYMSLIHKTYIQNNRNAAKVGNDEQEAILATLISDPRNLDNSQVASLYNMLAENMNWKKITGASVAVWRDKLQDVIYTRRHGTQAQQNNRAMQVKRRAPSLPLMYWTLDGWDAELMYQVKEKNRTTYHNRPTIVVVLDAYNKYPVGYAIGTHETPELTKEALRNAMRHTEELFGQMYRTAQVQSDRYAIGTMMPLYASVGDKVTPAKAHNAKAKVIEPWFLRFNKKYCQIQPNWSGFGVTSKKTSQPNVEFLNKYKKEFPDYDGVCRQLAMAIEAERAELREAYIAQFNQIPADKLLPMSMQQYLLHFGATTGHRNLMQGSGLKITIEGKKYDYDCFNPQFREHTSTRWQVMYDPDDMSRALAVNEDHTLQFLLEEKYVQPMALSERTEGDYEQLMRVREFNRQQSERNTERICEYQERATNFIEQHTTKELETLQKLLITDSQGQHKNQRNRERLQIEEAEIVADETITLNDLYDIY